MGTQTTEPTPGAQRLMDLLSGPPQVLDLARRLLADAWVVERLEELPGDFAGIAATRGGRVWFAPWGEVRQLSEGGTELLLARRNQRERLVAEVERVAQAELAAKASGEQALEGVRDQAFLVSKVYPQNAGRGPIERACEASLRRLKTDRLDLYLLHWRGPVPPSLPVRAG